MEQKCKTAKDGKSGRIDANAWSREAAKSAPVGALSIEDQPGYLFGRQFFRPTPRIRYFLGRVISRRSRWSPKISPSTESNPEAHPDILVVYKRGADHIRENILIAALSLEDAKNPWYRMINIDTIMLSKFYPKGQKIIIFIFTTLYSAFGRGLIQKGEVWIDSFRGAKYKLQPMQICECVRVGLLTFFAHYDLWMTIRWANGALCHRDAGKKEN